MKKKHTVVSDCMMMKIKVIALVCVTNAMKYVETCIRIATNNKVKKVYQRTWCLIMFAVTEQKEESNLKNCK